MLILKRSAEIITGVLDKLVRNYPTEVFLWSSRDQFRHMIKSSIIFKMYSHMLKNS